MAILIDMTPIALLVTGFMLFIYIGDSILSYLCREVWGLRWGLPKEFQQENSTNTGNPYLWRWLGITRINGVNTNLLFAAISHEGLAFTARSLFRQPIMRTVVVPWGMLRIETFPTSSGITGHTLIVINEAKEIATKIEPQWLEKSVVDRIKTQGTRDSNGEWTKTSSGS